MRIFAGVIWKDDMSDVLYCIYISKLLFDVYFSMFDDSLSKTVLDTEDGVGRIGSAKEFMFMGFTARGIAFKHIDTRNYIYMDRLTGELTIPKSSRYFGQGVFDVYNPVVFDWHCKQRKT